MFTRTKIICTMGPSVASYEQILALIHAGMNVARLNFSHGTHEEHAKMIALIKKARTETKKPVALLLDMQGPKIRVDHIQGGSLSLQRGQTLSLVEQGDGSFTGIGFHPFEVIHALKKGMTILFDDGYISGEVLQVSSQKIDVKILNPGILKTGKGINIPGAHLPLPAMTKKDFDDLQFGCKHDVDFIAGSYIRLAKNIQEIRDVLAKLGYPHIPVIAKIENQEGIENFASIAKAADGILVARGDLGVEIDLCQVPRLQKMMVRTCLDIGTPVITATHMLESMISNPRPTRAEVSDVANAVYDFSSLIMLSAETAVGKYPIEATRMMQRIAQETEADIAYKNFFMEHRFQEIFELEASTAFEAVRTAYAVEAKAIIIVGISDAVIRFVARLCPSMPTIALAETEKRYHQLGAVWGVFPVLSTSNQPQEIALQASKREGFLTPGDKALVLSGNFFPKNPMFNMIVVSI